MEIFSSNSNDLNDILDLYDAARNLQKIKGATLWPQFDKKLIETEIFENRLFKIVINNQIACVWSITFNDPEIWEEKDSDSAIYIHRIATNPNLRGKNLVAEIVKWAKKYANEIDKDFIRMDTVGENLGLINYYTRCGFDFLGLSKLKNTENLPEHYHNATVSLFQMSLKH